MSSMEKILSLSQLDLRGLYTYADYLTWQFDQAVELIKGKILPMAEPSRRHQQISRDLNGTLFNFFKKNPCEFYAAPFDVRLFDKRKSVKANKDVYSVVQPDICVICDESKLDTRGCLGAPDLVIEILSPSNRKYDTELKKQLYEQFGVPEYWIVDPDECLVSRYLLDAAGRFSDAVEFNETIIFDRIPGGAIVDLTRVW